MGENRATRKRFRRVVVRPGWSRIGWRWREIQRITKRTQSCARQAKRRVCRRISMDWFYPRPAKLEQERVSSGDSESSRNGDHSAGGVVEE